MKGRGRNTPPSHLPSTESPFTFHIKLVDHVLWCSRNGTEHVAGHTQYLSADLGLGKRVEGEPATILAARAGRGVGNALEAPPSARRLILKGLAFAVYWSRAARALYMGRYAVRVALQADAPGARSLSAGPPADVGRFS